MSLSKKNRNAIIVALMILLGGLALYKYMYKPHKSIDEIEVKYSGNSSILLSKIRTDALKWQDVVVEISGTITKIENEGIIIDQQIFCQFLNTETLNSLKENQEVKIKARVIGYDDLLEELKLDQTIIAKK